VRGLKGIKEASVNVNGTEVRVAVVHGAKHFKEICDTVRSGKAFWHFVEFMACPGGCVMGGGQPIFPDVQITDRRLYDRFLAMIRRRMEIAKSKEGVS